MSDDRRRPEQYASHRDAALGSWIAGTVYPYSRPLRAALDRAGLGRRGVRRAADLDRLPVVPIAELGDGRAHVLTPTAESVAAHGPIDERIRLRLADAFGRRPELARNRVEPVHRPVRWTATEHADGSHLFAASTAPDLDRLAALGRRSLAISGLRPSDRLLLVGGGGPGVAPLQLLEGCREAGLALLHAADADDRLAAEASPSVVAGDAAQLGRLVRVGLPASVRLLVRLGDTPLSGPRIDGTDLPVADWWAPPGVRAAWVRCPGGDGHHSWPMDEVTQMVDDELVWSAVGWHGSVWLRVGTGIRATIHHGTCRACGRTTPRIAVTTRPAWMGRLDAADAVAGWIAVRRPDGSEVVIVQPADRSPRPGDGWRRPLADEVGRRLVVVSADRFRHVRDLAGDAEVVEESTVAPALTKAAQG